MKAWTPTLNCLLRWIHVDANVPVLPEMNLSRRLIRTLPHVVYTLRMLHRVNNYILHKTAGYGVIRTPVMGSCRVEQGEA